MCQTTHRRRSVCSYAEITCSCRSFQTQRPISNAAMLEQLQMENHEYNIIVSVGRDGSSGTDQSRRLTRDRIGDRYTESLSIATGYN